MDSCTTFSVIFYHVVDQYIVFLFDFFFFLVCVCVYTHSRKNMGRVKCPDSYAILLFGGSQPGAVGATRNISQCQEKILFVRIGLVGVCYGYIVKEARDAVNVLQCTGQGLAIKNYQAQNVSGSEVEKPWTS